MPNQPIMFNLDVAASSFWQLARRWKAKLELLCEDGSLHMHLSAQLGHPDQPHFPHPPPQHAPPPSGKKNSTSQLRRQERRKQEAQSKADEAASATPATSDNIVPANVSTGKEAETVEAESQESAVKPVDISAEQVNHIYKCN